jgi:hypothetical protein
MSPIAPPPPQVLDHVSDLISFFRNIDQVEALVNDLRAATTKQQEVMKASGMLEKLAQMDAGVQTEAEAMKAQAAQELEQAQAARAEAEQLRQELQSQKIAADDRLTEAEARLAEAEAIKADAENRRKQLLALVQAPLAAAGE